MRRSTEAEVAKLLAARPPGGQIYVGGFRNHPAELVRILVDLGERANAPTIVAALPAGLSTALKRWRGPGRIELTHSIDGFDEAIAKGYAAYRVGHLGDLAVDLRRPAPRVTLVRVTPPDADGRCHLGFEVDTTLDAIHGGEVVVAQLDSSLPRAAGASWIHVDDITVAIDGPPHAHEPIVISAQPDDAEVRVARRVAELIPGGAALELGVGRLPDIVADALVEHRRLRIHTGVVTAPLVRLLRAGAVDASPRPPFLAPVVATMAVNEAEVLEALRSDPRIELHPASVTHRRGTLGSLPRFHAVNGALGVALDGSVNSELVGGRRVAAIGGLMDFREGARLSAGGKFIVAMTSVRRSGASRILPRLDGPATIGSPDAGWVVTEFGAVDLGPLNLADRAEAMIAIAHPDHRDALEAARRTAR